MVWGAGAGLRRYGTVGEASRYVSRPATGTGVGAGAGAGPDQSIPRAVFNVPRGISS